MSKEFQTREEIASQISIREIILHPDNTVFDLHGLETKVRQEALAESGLVFGEEKAEGEAKRSTELARRMIEMEWIDYEKASGKGHLRFYPKGAIGHSVLEHMVHSLAQNRLEVIPVVTPMVFNWDDDQISGEAGTFQDNLYHVRPGGDPNASGQVLRFGGDFGVFKVMQDAKLIEAQLPLRVYEAGVGFRSNKPGERSNIQRADSFYLPCSYSFCRNDISAGIDEFVFLHTKFSEFLAGLGLEYSHVFEINETFFNQHREEISGMLQQDNKPALIKLASGKRLYYEMKGDHVVGNEFKSFNIQFDNENAQTYGINYSNGQVEEPCVIVHSSLATVERWMLISLDDALKKSPQELPLWLAPVQTRIIPLDEKYMERVVNIARNLNSQGIRTDVDDRNGKINSKVRKASNELVPYVILWGRN